MGVFDFITKVDSYTRSKQKERLELRYQFIVEPFAELIEGGRVLDLAAHDGRWSYALAFAGAKHVEAVEGRQHLVDRFQQFPDDEFRARVNLEQGDIFEKLEALVAAGEKFDVVAVYGIFYHITDHYRLLCLISELDPKAIIIDSEFYSDKGPVVRFSKENPDIDLNSSERVEGQEKTLIGTPSRIWVHKAAETLGYTWIWMPWEELEESRRIGVPDYFRDSRKQRGTVALVKNTG